MRQKKGLFIVFVLSVTGFFLLVAFESFSPVDSITGKDIYRLNCAACHGTDRSGYSDFYPSLINIQESLSKEEVLKQINNGKGQMPPFPHITPEEKNSLIAFLFEEKNEIVESSIENLGERIFLSNCSSCHRATVNDPKPLNVRMMEPAPLAGATKRFTKEEIFKILETGVCYMPSFSHFTLDEREELYSFIKSLEGKGEPKRPTMGEMCPMMMKMRKK